MEHGKGSRFVVGLVVLGALVVRVARLRARVRRLERDGAELSRTVAAARIREPAQPFHVRALIVAGVGADFAQLPDTSGLAELFTDIN